jgi:superfamily II DNA or RNA helicase
MKIIVNNLRSKIETDNDKLLKALIEYYTFTTPGAFWTKGDGKKRFLHKTGYFRTGLLERVLSDLKKIGCDPEIVYNFDHRSPTLLKHSADKPLGTYKLYDFQQSIVRQAKVARRAIIKSPTGSGKTLIMAALLREMKYPKTLILFTQKHLVNQTYEFFKTVGVPSVGYCTGEGYIPGNIMLCTVQSLERVVQEFIDCKCFMVDEAHEFSQSSDRETVINSFPEAFKRYAFTATVPSDNIGRFRLEGAFGALLEVVTTAELIDEGKLTKPLIKLLKMPSEAKINDSLSYFDLYDMFIINNKYRNNKIKEIVDNVRKKNKKAKIVILVKNLEHMDNLQKLIPKAITLQGSDHIKDRYIKIGKFVKKGGVVIGTKILQTGVNIEEITHLINARGLAKDIPTIQALGRALRKHDSKTEVYIYDFLDSVKYLNIHSRKRKSHYKKEGHEIEEI